MYFSIALFRQPVNLSLLQRIVATNQCITRRTMSRVPVRVSPVVSVDWLAEKLQSNPSNFAVLDCSWHLPITKRNARREFTQSHIPGAQFFDIDECCDKTSEYDHMMPTTDVFSEFVGKMGVGNDIHVVVYDNNANFGLFSAPRVWWMFRMFGHTSVSVLDGGFPKWIQKEYSTTDEGVVLPPKTFKALANNSFVRSYDEMVENLEKKSFQVVDARSAGRFEGSAPEPRAGIKPGHMPNAKNVPFNTMVDSETKLMKSADDLKEVFKTQGVDINQPLTATCGSGVSACVVALGLYVCGREETPVFDGSWVEWYKRAKHGQIITTKS